MATETEKLQTLYTNNVCRRLMVGAISQLLVEKLDEMKMMDPIWKQKFKSTGNKFLRELDKETNMLLGVQETSEELLKLTNILDDELKVVFAHTEKEVLSVINYEKNKSKEVSEEV